VETVQISEVDTLRILYQDIVQGVSSAHDGSLHFRHFTELDHTQILKNRLVVYRKYIAEGLPSEKERLKTIIENEEWSQDQEDRITSLRLTISDNEKNISKIIPQQQGMIKKIIDKDKNELIMLLANRAKHMGSTADELSFNDTNHFTFLLGVYNDVECKNPRFKSIQEIEDTDPEELTKIQNLWNNAMSSFSEENVRELSAMNFFLNSFSYAKDSIYTFLQKPIVYLTTYQVLLFSLGQRNISILSQAEGTPPEMIGDVKPKDVLTWYDKQYSVILGKRNSAK